MSRQTSVDEEEVTKFNRLAKQWWDKDGPLKTLHDINACRLTFIENQRGLAHCRVLDVGCGGGILTEAMAQQQAQVTGLDVDPEIIQAATQHAQQQAYSIDYQCIAIEDYDAKPFQIITCMEMLEHVSNPKLIVHHCARLLEPGGYLFLSTINRTLKAYVTAVLGAEYVLKLLPKQTHDYHRFIKPSELSQILREEGLMLVDLQGMHYNPFTRKAMLQPSVEVNYLMAFVKT